MDYYFDQTNGIYIEEQTGAAYFTQNGVAKALNKTSTDVRRLFQRGVISEQKKAEVLTTGGLQGVSLIPATEVYDLAFEYNPALAKAMGKAGAVAYAHTLAGWKQKQEQKPMSQAEAALYTLQLAVETERRTAVVESKVERLEKFAPVEGYSTLVAYVNSNDVQKPKHYPSVGKALVKLSEEMGYTVKSVPDAKYGSCNTYALPVLEAYFS